MKHPILKLSVLIGAGYAAYHYLLDENSRQTVRTTAQAVFDKVKALVDKVSGTEVVDVTDYPTLAQRWAAEQWEAAGFGAES